VEAEVGRAWGEIISAGLNNDFVGGHPTEVDEEVLGRIVVGLNLRMGERRGGIRRCVANLLTEGSAHAQELTKWGVQTLRGALAVLLLLI
jgi:hypothetical protein